MRDFFAIDFETATVYRNSACAVGIAGFRQGVVIERYYWLIRPPENIYDQSCIDVHGITPDMTEPMRDIRGIHAHLMGLLDGCHIVAHNAAFDVSVLEESLAYHNLPVPRFRKISCTCKMSGWKALNVCCQEFGIPLTHHDALSDAEAAARLFLYLTDSVNKPVYSESFRKIRPTGFGDQRRKVSSETLAAPDLSSVENKKTIFFNKKVVITGILDSFPVREELAVRLKSYGAFIQSSISGRTDLVICGKGAGPMKLKKIDQINASGKGKIEVLTEEALTAYLENL